MRRSIHGCDFEEPENAGLKITSINICIGSSDISSVSVNEQHSKNSQKGPSKLVIIFIQNKMR